MIKTTKEETFRVETDIRSNGTVICSEGCEKHTFCLFNISIPNPDEDCYEPLFIPQDGCPVFGQRVGSFDVKIITEVTRAE